MAIPFIKMAFIGLLPSAIKVAYYRMRGARIGKNVKIGLFSIISADDIEIGDNSRIGILSFINARRIRIGNRVKIANIVAMDTADISIGHDSVVMEHTVVGGMLTPRSSLFIGCRVKVFPYCFINPTEPIVIEDEVGVGGSTYLFTHGSWQSALDGFPIGFGPIHLRKGVWLPWRVFILPNVDVGEYSTIGAGSVINRSIPSRSLAAGMPAKVISEDGKYLKKLDSDQRWEKILEIFREFSEYLNFEGTLNTISENNSNYYMNICGADQKKYFSIELARDEIKALSASTVFISMNEISTNDRKLISDQGKSWFDLNKCETNLGQSIHVENVRNYFSRYGVRFSVVTDKEFKPR